MLSSSFAKKIRGKRMHCRSRNVADTAVFTQETSPLSSKRDAFLAAILAQNMEKYAVAAGSKRSCPFAGPVKRQRICRPDEDVEDLEARLVAGWRRKKPQAKTHVNTNRLHSILQACLKQVQREATDLPSCTQLKYEPSVDAPVYRLMEERVAYQNAHLAHVFRDAGLEENKTDFSDARVVTGDQQGTFIRFTVAKVAPFAPSAVSEAMWNGVKKSSVLNMGAADSAIKGGDDSVIYVKRECLLQDDASRTAGISVLLRGVCRRFVEPHRIVLVWEGTGDWPKDYLRSYPGSVPIRERGYCVVQNLLGGNSKSGRDDPLSLIQTCVCMTPGLSADIDMNEPECLEMLSNVVIPSYRKLLDAREQMLENSILDEMIHSKLRGSAARI